MGYITKYRPKNFDEFVGNDDVVSSVKSVLDAGDAMMHGWLFSGPAGCGKTTMARIIGKMLGASDAAIHETDAARYRKLEDMRQLLKQVVFRTPGSKVSVYILDECHQITSDAQNALLKTLEQPPGHVYFILCTTEPEKVKDTIRQRCLSYKLQPLKDNEIDELIGDVAVEEKITVSDDVADAIIAASAGSPRWALNLLQKCHNKANDLGACRRLIEDALYMEDEGTPGAKKVVDLLLGRSKAHWQEVANVLGRSIITPGAPDQIAEFKRAMIGILNRVLLKAPQPWIARAILLLEVDLFGGNTRGGLTARIYQIWDMCSETERNGSTGGRQRPSSRPDEGRGGKRDLR